MSSSSVALVDPFSGIVASGITPVIATYLVEANGKQPWYLIYYFSFAAVVSMFSAIASVRRKMSGISCEIQRNKGLAAT